MAPDYQPETRSAQVNEAVSTVRSDSLPAADMLVFLTR